MTPLLLRYPPLPDLESCSLFIPEKHGIPVVGGTHPNPEKYRVTHEACHTWDDPRWADALAPTMADRATRLAYD